MEENKEGRRGIKMGGEGMKVIKKGEEEMRGIKMGGGGSREQMV